MNILHLLIFVRYIYKIKHKFVLTIFLKQKKVAVYASICNYNDKYSFLEDMAYIAL